MVWVSAHNRKATCCTLYWIKTEIQVFENMRCVKYVRIRVSSDPYIFPYKAESSIVSLNRKIRVSESPYCHIFYAVIVFILIYKHQGHWSTMHHWMQRLQPYPWMTAVKFALMWHIWVQRKHQEMHNKLKPKYETFSKFTSKVTPSRSPNLFLIWYSI